MIEKWRNMSAGDRLRAQIVFSFLLVGLYGLVFFPASHEKYFESKKMLSRRMDRIEKRANIDDIGNIGPNRKTVMRKIEEVNEQLKEIASAFDELDTGFAPVESSDVRQQLMLEISTLAERTGVALLSVSRKGYSPQGEMTMTPVDPVLGRPLLVVTANARYWDLLEFLHGLKDLSFHASVMNLKLYSQNPGRGRRGETPAPAGALYVSLEVSI